MKTIPLLYKHFLYDESVRENADVWFPFHIKYKLHWSDQNQICITTFSTYIQCQTKYKSNDNFMNKMQMNEQTGMNSTLYIHTTKLCTKNTKESVKMKLAWVNIAGITQWPVLTFNVIYHPQCQKHYVPWHIYWYTIIQVKCLYKCY